MYIETNSGELLQGLCSHNSITLTLTKKPKAMQSREYTNRDCAVRVYTEMYVHTLLLVIKIFSNSSNINFK